MKIIFFLSLTISFLLCDNFYKNGNYVVDKTHNIYWQDTKDNITILKSQAGAVKYCEDLRLSGYNDWKLPTVKEYKYIIDKTRNNDLMINRKFKYILSDQYWTQDTRWQSLWRYGFYIFFKSGNIYFDNKMYPKYVRCVRGKR